MSESSREESASQPARELGLGSGLVLEGEALEPEESARGALEPEESARGALEPEESEMGSRRSPWEYRDVRC